MASAEDGRRWAENWHANEIRWLHTAVEDLERRLRRRTIALVAALAFSGLLAVVAAGSAVMQRHGPEPPVAVFEAASPPDPSAGSSLAVGKADRPSETRPLQAQLALAVARPSGPGEPEERDKAGGEDPATVEQKKRGSAQANPGQQPAPTIATPPHGPEPLGAAVEVISPPGAPAGSPSVAGKAERASEIEPFQLHRALAVARPNGSGDLDGRGKAVGPEPATEPTGGPAQTGAEQPEHPLELVRRSGSATAAAQDSNAPTRKEAEQQAITGREASTGVEALRAALMATKARIEGLETAGTQHEAQP